MEDQGKRLMIAVAIAFGIMMVWTTLFPPDPPPKKPEVVEADALATGIASETGEDKPSSDSAEPATPSTGATATERGAEEFFDFENAGVRAKFSSYGGSLVSWELLAPRLEDRKRNAPEQLIRVPGTDYPDLRVWFDDSTFDIPATAEWKGEKRSETELRFVWESADLRVTKDIILRPKDYLIEMAVKVELVGAPSAKQALAVSLYSAQKEAIESGTFDRVTRAWKAACFYDDEIHSSSAKSLDKKGRKERVGSIYWAGFDHAYFLSAVAIKGGSGLRMQCDAYPLDKVAGGMGLDLIQGSVDLKKGEPGIKSAMVFYFGPKYQDSINGISEVAGFDTRMEEAVDLGYLGLIAGPLLSLLRFFQSFVVNWGIAIFLLTLVVKGLTLPWTHKSMKSMKAMASLKPQLEKIKEKYADDRARQNVETMSLFKANKVNPMSGCLPMILQMPIWFALYRALTVAGELYQAPLIDGWIDDLTLPDPYYVMPALLTGMMFLQTRLTPSTGSGAQQKFLMYGMPLMFGGMSFMFPSGLTLYIFTNTLFTAGHHMYMRKAENTPEAKAKAEALQAAANKIIDVDPVESEEDSDGKTKSKKKKTSGSKGKKKRRR